MTRGWRVAALVTVVGALLGRGAWGQPSSVTYPPGVEIKQGGTPQGRAFSVDCGADMACACTGTECTLDLGASIAFGADPADTGVVRLSNAEQVCWEANPTGADACLSYSTGNEFTFNGADVGLTNNGTARKVKFYEPSGSGTNYSSIEAQAQSTNFAYKLPAPGALGNGFILATNAGGTLNWGRDDAQINVLAGACNGTTPGTGMDLPASDAPTPTCVTGTNVLKGVLRFSDAGNTCAQVAMQTPDDAISGLGSLRILYTTPSVTNGETQIWTVATACRFPATGGGGNTDDPAWNAAQSLTYTNGASEVADSLRQVSMSDSLTMTGCTSAGTFMHLRICRDVADTATDALDLVSFTLSLPRSG